MTNIHLYSQQ